MNGPTHESYNLLALQFLYETGLAPRAAGLLSRHQEAFALSGSKPDNVNELAILFPGVGLKTSFLGHGASSFLHFPGGYRWQRDPSLLLSTATAAISQLANLSVAETSEAPRPPLANNVNPTPIQEALLHEPGYPVGLFHFPTAGKSADYYVEGAKAWARDANGVGFARCAGFASHFWQDSTCPHHEWNALFMGHEAWENSLERNWAETASEVLQYKLFSSIVEAVTKDLATVRHCTTGSALCQANAAWARRHFGAPRTLEDCPGNETMQVSIRAIAATVRGLELMSL